MPVCVRHDAGRRHRLRRKSARLTLPVRAHLVPKTLADGGRKLCLDLCRHLGMLQGLALPSGSPDLFRALSSGHLPHPFSRGAYHSCPGGPAQGLQVQKSCGSLAGKLAPMMVAAQLMTGTNDVFQSVSPAVDAILHAPAANAHVAHAHHKHHGLWSINRAASQGGTTSAFHSTAVQLIYLEQAPELTTPFAGVHDPSIPPLTLSQLQLQQPFTRGVSLHAAASLGAMSAVLQPGASIAMPAGGASSSLTGYDVKAAGDALASMTQAQTTSDTAIEGVMSEGRSFTSTQSSHARRTTDLGGTAANAQSSMQTWTRGAGSTLMRLDSLRRRMRKEVTRGLGRLWLSWREEQDQMQQECQAEAATVTAVDHLQPHAKATAV